MIGGDPGRVPSELTLDNWQSAAYLHWTFQHIGEFLPTAQIARGGPVAQLPSATTLVSDIAFHDPSSGRRRTV